VNHKQRHHVEALERRAAHLRRRIAERPGSPMHWDRAEVAALVWAIDIIRAADAEGILDDLHAIRGVTIGVGNPKEER